MKLAYMAHPLGPDGAEREKNRANATKWFGWLHDHFPSLVFTANWIVLSGAWPETDEHRKRGLDIDMIHVDRSELIFYVGGRMSPGMVAEQSRAAARGAHQVDLTFLGYAPPEREVNGYIRELDKALTRIPPLDPEFRESFNKNLTERLSLKAFEDALLLSVPGLSAGAKE